MDFKGMSALGGGVLMLVIGAIACGGQTIKQEAEPVTVTETVTVGAGEGTSTEAETPQKKSRIPA